MNHLAAFLLRLAAQSVLHYHRGFITDGSDLQAFIRLLDAANAYDRQVIPIEVPAWMLWNAPGGAA